MESSGLLAGEGVSLVCECWPSVVRGTVAERLTCILSVVMALAAMIKILFRLRDMVAGSIDITDCSPLGDHTLISLRFYPTLPISQPNTLQVT